MVVGDTRRGRVELLVRVAVGGGRWRQMLSLLKIFTLRETCLVGFEKLRRRIIRLPLVGSLILNITRTITLTGWHLC